MLSVATARPKKPDCKNFHGGTFEIGNAGISVIERKGNFQTETNAKHDYKAQYDVDWIDECIAVEGSKARAFEL